MTVQQNAANMAIEALTSFTLTEEQKPFACFIGNVLHALAEGRLIEVKLAPGTTAWTIYEGQIYTGTISNIQIGMNERTTRINYTIGAGSQSPPTFGRDEAQVFGSEQELLNRAIVKP